MAQTLPTQTGTTRVLLIGVNDYSSFDDCSDLKGSRNDVLALASYCVQVLGIPAGNIHVLTSPKLTIEELTAKESIPGMKELTAENLREATEQQVKNGLRWLLDSAQHGRALLAFSGHGAWSKNEGPLLCFSDTASDFSHGVLSLRDLGDQIKRAGAQDRLIALFDCCHVSAPKGPRRGLRGKALPNEGTAEDVARHEDLFNVSSRVILAARPGQEAYQARFGGMWHGAFTFALVTAAERWQCENELSHGAYKHVLKRAKGTLKALGVPQHPALRSPAERWGAIREQPFLGVGTGTTVRKPDAVQEGVQLDGGYRYLFQGKDALGNLIDLAVVIAVGATSVPITLGTNAAFPPTTGTDSGKECWYVNTNNVQRLGSGSYSIVVTKTTLATSESVVVMSSSSATTGFAGSGGQLNTSSPYIQSNETTSAGWVRTAPVHVGTPVYFKSTSGTKVIWMAWDLSAVALNQVIWYVVTTTQPTTIQPTNGTPFTYQSSAPVVGSYYQCPSNSSS